MKCYFPAGCRHQRFIDNENSCIKNGSCGWQFGEVKELKKKDKIICLVGESGSGKTTIAKEFEKEGYNIIKSYTTRPVREEDEWGHIFVDEKNYIKHRKQDLKNMFGMIAHTYFDNHHYWAMREQYKCRGTSIYIIDPVGIKDLYNNVKDAEIVVIYLKVDEAVRTYRMIERTYDDEDPWYYDNTIDTRIKHDKEAFKVVKCDYSIDADRKIEEVLKDIREVIK